ncbi:unnamed protein product [Bursaphelenchus xylophilus]|uniref:(pine wood nematode) hypothetical protein n=1 Tax=Bursaphelenchus xylophilus TaxID=6326 RepID=A0A1I7RVQ3_BURXY|nr:unnamed protein product [Bursaphelenchus xylophilus]CAG9082001.1 unnamed protein product [Bursaphelenchus xylophilus]
MEPSPPPHEDQKPMMNEHEKQKLNERLKILQAEEKALLKVMIDLNSQARKLGLEKIRLLELAKQKVKEEEEF